MKKFKKIKNKEKIFNLLLECLKVKEIKNKIDINDILDTSPNSNTLIKKYIFSIDNIISSDRAKYKEYNQKNVQKYVETILLSYLMQNAENKYADYIDTFEDDNITIKKIYEIFPKYISYAYKNTQDKSIMEEFSKSKPGIIKGLGEDIADLIIKINQTILPSKSPFFEYNAELSKLISQLPRGICQSESDFSTLVSNIYTGIYESSGISDNRLYKLCVENEIDSSIMDVIKYYRTNFEHKLHKGDSKKIKLIHEYNQSVIGKKVPESQSDYVALQISIYKDVKILLKNVLDIMNHCNEDS